MLPQGFRIYNKAASGRSSKSFIHEGRLALMKQLAEECKVSVIDLAHKSKQLYKRLGSEQSKCLFLWLKTGEHPNYPNGSQDNTHFCNKGAHVIAKLVLEGMNELGYLVQKDGGK